MGKPPQYVYGILVWEKSSQNIHETLAVAEEDI
jgi:hypothetical protein